METAGEPDREELGVDAPNWPLSIALAVVILGCLVVGLLAWTDDGSSLAAGPAGRTERPAGPASEAPRSTTSATGTSAATTSATTTSTTSTSAATTSTVPAGWTPVSSPEDGFSAAFPTTPTVSRVPIATMSGPTTRVEYVVDGPDDSVVSVTSIGGPPAVGADLSSVVAQVGRDLSATAIPGAPTVVDGLPAVPFRVRTSRGQVRGLVVAGREHLVTVSMFMAGSGSTSTADAVFDGVVASLHLR